MKLSWLGHSCFLMELSSGLTIITDPYEHKSFSGAVKYLPICQKADVVTVSHHHADHDFISGVPGASVFDSPGSFTVDDLVIEGIESFHDAQKGAVRGKNIIYVFNAESLRVAHFGDLGTTTALPLEKLEHIDAALIPVGGTFTIDSQEANSIIDKLKPSIVVPMHYKTPKLDFDIDTVEPFLEGKSYIEHGGALEITKAALPDTTKIVVLSYMR